MSATFAFKPGDLVLVKWNDSMVYFAKVKKIDQRRKKCVVVFDDKSHDEADFDQIHSGESIFNTTSRASLSRVIERLCGLPR